MRSPNLRSAIETMNLPDKKTTKQLNKKFKCDQCSLQFSTLVNLTNHKRKPCVKSTIFNSNHTTIKPIASKSEKKISSETEKDDYFLKPKRRLNSPNAYDNDTFDQRSVQNETKVLEQLYNYKSKKSVEQSVRDIEDLIIRDTIRNGRNLNSSQPVTVPNEVPISTINNEGYQYQQIINEVIKMAGLGERVLCAKSVYFCQSLKTILWIHVIFYWKIESLLLKSQKVYFQQTSSWTSFNL
jgi:hypothetical protein